MDPPSTNHTTLDASENLPDTTKKMVSTILSKEMVSDPSAAVQDHLQPRPSGQYTTLASPEDSGSTLSSIESEPLSTVPDMQGASLTKVDVNGILRYGSLDADETGLSSVTSVPSINKRSFHEIHSYPESQVSDDDRVAKRQALSSESARLSDGVTPSSRSSLLSNIQVEARPNPEISASLRDNRIQSAPKAPTPKTKKFSKVSRLTTHARPRSSIPINMSWEEYGRQCISAAHSSRLNPYALHPGEYRLLRDHITQAQVTTYLNIRNGILRLWVRNPLVSVSQEEAAGCAKDVRFFDLAHTSYWWLVRNGYINFGCVEVPHAGILSAKRKSIPKQRTVVVVGAGMAGLSCARQLEGLFAQLGDHWTDAGELPPKVVVLEGRNRVGGRVYSHPLREQAPDSLPNGLRNTAEMGAQIITGFNHGNPLNAIVRGQLALRYHLMWDEITMYDSDGLAVNHERDMMVNKIHNDLLERASDFRVKPTPIETLEGIPDYIDVCQDPVEIKTDRTNAPTLNKERQQAVPPGFAKLQGRTQVVAGNSSSRTAAQAVRSAGWQLRPGITKRHSLALDAIATESDKPTLGATMDEAVRQYQELVELTPQDMRLLNWHYADLEYANAATVSNLSLGGHDQDSGNEFEGRHSEVVGGYIQVPRGLMMLPYPLDVRFGSVVEKITYNVNGDDADSSATVTCSNGDVFEADQVILTSPLGVLKAETITFEPALPDWKKGAIERMGFGLLNKVVMVFPHAFWDSQYDMFGFLNDAENKDSLNPDDYATRRGRFYMMWNCEKNSGRPVLSALMSGRAAHEVEITDNDTLLEEALEKLRRTFGAENVPTPVEVIVTRWKKDPFARGTYSFVGPATSPLDYDIMAAPVGNLHFAGEATCGTHPATVHGAYLSGLRAAADAIDTMIGQMAVPEPLVLPRQSLQVAGIERASELASTESPMRDIFAGTPSAAPKRVGRPPGRPSGRPPGRPPGRPKKVIEPVQHLPAVTPNPPVQSNPYRSSTNSKSVEDEAYEAAIIDAILSELGPRPIKPARPGASVNPYLLFTNDSWARCKEELSQAKQKASGDSTAKALREEIRSEVGRQWRMSSDEVKRPYIEQTQAAQQAVKETRAQYEKAAAQWDEDARRIRLKYQEEHPPTSGNEWSGSTSIEMAPLAAPRRKQTINYTESDGE
ncbi:hypothetical protein QM012_008690 [Aureobasidium pullulans]|uniref:SWIRM domain-containing protein n=1 Tax=Aureobasidium pullulans TaxID=5580 RepID=A0ABR0THC4_AURPU